MDHQSTVGPQGVAPVTDRGSAPAIIIPGRTEREAEKEFMLDFIQRSNDKRQDFLDIWDEVLENYLVTFPRNSIEIRGFNQVETKQHLALRSESQLKDPETHQIIESLAGQMLGLLLGSRDYITTLPVGYGDYDKARMLSRTLMAALDEPGVYRTMYEVCKDAFIFGTGILEIGWETRVRPQMTLVPVLDRNTGIVTGKRLQPQWVVYRDRPLIKGVDIYDFYPDPSGTRIQENMMGCAKRFRQPRFRIEAMTGPNGPYHFMDAVGRALESVRDNQNDEEQHGRKRITPKQPPSAYQMVSGFEFWGMVPWKPVDGFPNRVITMINGEIVRSHINPFIDGGVPFIEIVMNPMQGRFYGLSPAEVIRYLQDSADTMLATLTDSADLAVRAPLLVGRGADVDRNRLKVRVPNDIIDCGDPTKVKALEQDMNVLQFGAMMMQQRIQRMREASGRTDVAQAISKRGEQTAFEVGTLAQAATQRVDVMCRLIERDAFPHFGRTLHYRLRQFIPAAGMIATLGSEQFPFTLDDIDFESDVRFVGSRDGKSRAEKAAELQAALSTLAGAGDLLFVMPELIIRYLRDGLDIQEAEEIAFQALQRQAALADLRLNLGMQVEANRGAASPPAQRGQGRPK